MASTDCRVLPFPERFAIGVRVLPLERLALAALAQRNGEPLGRFVIRLMCEGALRPDQPIPRDPGLPRGLTVRFRLSGLAVHVLGDEAARRRMSLRALLAGSLEHGLVAEVLDAAHAEEVARAKRGEVLG